MINETSVGVDLSPKSFLENGCIELYQTMAINFMQLLSGNDLMSDDWRSAKGVLPNKLGNVLDLDDYRAIMCNCTMAKVFTAILNSRLSVFFKEWVFFLVINRGHVPNAARLTIFLYFSKHRKIFHCWANGAS